ncbi:MAG: DUF4129 domain-containing protein [Myxococcaceae bacterium]|nr:DUF4129 domain-containing protein [Myxococcaceae bacterium]
MAVDALQLRPRHTLALFDSALRATAGSSGLWVILLPAAALIVWAFFQTAEAVQRGRPLTGPVALLTLAFVARCLTQGAATHFLEQQILSKDEPTVRGSLLAALRRLPGLIVAGTLQLVIDFCLVTFTFGIGFFFIGAHQAIFAAAMRGEGSALALYGTASKLLGGARHTAPFVRACNGLQLLLVLNLHIATSFLVMLGQQLLALDLNFINRFTSLDNGVWIAMLFVVAYVLFEPIRAATGVLLLIDGRVRQEGLDLIALVEQLPRRKKPKAPLAVVTALALLAVPALAQTSQEPTALRQRVERLVDECEMEPRVEREQVSRIDKVGERDHSALSRFISRVERRAYDEQDCDAAEKDLREGLLELEATQAPEAALDARAARDDASQILARPEFQQIEKKHDEAPKGDEAKPDGPWQAFWDQVGKWLKRFFEWLLERDDKPDVKPPAFAGGEMFGANAVIIVIVVLLVGLLVFLLLQLLPKKAEEQDGGEALASSETPLTSDPMSALSKRPETWAGLADELAAKGQYREAIRHLYLALLSTLHRAGVIDYDPTKSNWDYLFAFKGGGAQKSAFRELTRRFDFAWYGNLEVSDGAYATFRRIVQPLLAQQEARADA